MIATTIAHPAPSGGNLLYRVGVDGGGTSTRARLTTLDGQILGEGKAGPSGLMQGIGQAWHNIQQAFDQAIDNAVQAGALAQRERPSPHNTAFGLGIAGINNPQWRNEFLSANPGYPHIQVDTDAFAALLGAHAGRPGAIVIAGTGSIALAWHADGARSTSGGWGFPSGDEGSGSHIGLRAANLAEQACDGRLAPTELTAAVVHAVGGTPARLLEWCGQAGQQQFASLAPIVFELEHKDRLAALLINDAVQAVESLIHALDPNALLPLAIWGSVGQRLAPRLQPAVQARLTSPVGDALSGALSLSLNTPAHQ